MVSRRPLPGLPRMHSRAPGLRPLGAAARRSRNRLPSRSAPPVPRELADRFSPTASGSPTSPRSRAATRSTSPDSTRQSYLRSSPARLHRRRLAAGLVPRRSRALLPQRQRQRDHEGRRPSHRARARARYPAGPLRGARDVRSRNSGATTTLRPTGGFSCWFRNAWGATITSFSTGSRSWSAWSRRSGEEYSAAVSGHTGADDYSTGFRWISRSSCARAIT